MQDNQQTLESSQSKLRQDMLNHSFSDLQDDREDDNYEEQATRIDISEEATNSCQVIIKGEPHEAMSKPNQPQTIHISVQQVQRNNDEMHQLSGLVQTKDQQMDKKKDQQLANKQNDKINQEHIQKIRIIYSCSFLGSQKITLSQIKKLKSFLYVPKHGEELVRWGNQKFGTQHTVVSALQRLQYLQDSECSELTIKLKQNLKYVLLLILCLVVIKVFL